MEARSALALQVEWGADEALGPAPVMRLRDPAAPAAPPRPQAAPAPRPQAAVPAMSSLAAFADALAQFDGAGLAAMATHLLLPVGRATPLLVVAEAPGEDEDRTGEAFSGPAGRLALKMLASIGVSLDQAMLAYLVPWRPPGGRAPSDTEIAACLPYLHRLIALARPTLLLALGSVPAKALLDGPVRRGRWGEAAIPGLDQPLPVLPTANPAVLLRQPGQKPAAWAELRVLRRRIDKITAS